jgi:hypothetical protein
MKYVVELEFNTKEEADDFIEDVKAGSIVVSGYDCECVTVNYVGSYQDRDPNE